MTKRTKIITILAFIALSVIVALQYEYILHNDISIESISKANNPDFQATSYHHREPVYLVSYAAGHEVFYRNQNALVLSGLNKGIDFFLNYRRSHIDPDFYQKNKNILDKPRGAGYWIWKPYFILKTMENAPENAIIIYCDTGFVFHTSPKSLIDGAKSHDITLVKYDPADYGYVKKHASGETLRQMDCTSQTCKDSEHILAGFSVYRNTARARQFVREWLNYCTVEDIIFGKQGGEPEDPAFRNHGDDETVLSVLHAKHSEWCNLITKDQLYDLVYYHHRHPAYNNNTIIYRMHKSIVYKQIRNIYRVTRVVCRAYFKEYFSN